MEPQLIAFYGGLALFFAMHFFTVFRSRTEQGLAHRLGRGPYMGLYSLLSLIGLIAMIWGFGEVRWPPTFWKPEQFPWTRHVAMTLMLPAILLIVAAYVPTGYIKKAVGHPMLIAVTLWALAHLIANGDLGSIILFGSFLVFAIIDRIVVSSRGDRGAAAANPNIFGDLIAVAVGGALYAALVFYLHPLLFGVPVIIG
jgi:uncharacterized membrane protein